MPTATLISSSPSDKNNCKIPHEAMGKKKSQDLKTLIKSNSDFFDNLVKLIPPKFYIHDPEDDDKPWFQGLSKTAKASAKKLSRKNLKKARRLRFNPDSPSSTLDLLQKSIKSNQNPDESGLENANAKSENWSITYEELRQKLRQKIEEAKSKRNTRQNDEPRNYQKKRKREIEEKNEENEKKDNNLVADIEFGKVKIGGEDEKRKKKKISKFQELEKATKLEELKKDPEKGEAIAKKHSWKAAESRAMGLKVHDDPKLLRESIKKEKKRKKKNTEKWKERAESRDSVMKEKQKTRTENIRDRAQQKKMRRIEKREKKLMRPGFEGRKEGYINE